MYQDEYLKIVDSTNNRARELAERGASHGSGVLAAQQTAGRGRLRRVWFSPPGSNLYCSFIIRPTVSISEYPRLTMVAGLAVAQFINALLPGRVGLKWPNDILLGRKKCGGILCESVLPAEQVGSGCVIVGIGLNLAMKSDVLPEDLRGIATSLLIEGGPQLSPEAVFPLLRQELLACVDQWQEHGFLPILERWREFDVMYGQYASWVNRNGEVVTGISLGPDHTGQLIIRDSDGTCHEVLSGDVTLVQNVE